MKSTYFILPVTLFIVSCSSTQKRKEPVEHFVAHITEDGTKKFSYSLTPSNPRGGNKGGKRGGGRNEGGGGRGGKGGGQDGKRGKSGEKGDNSDQKFKMQERLVKKLERALFEKEYCREGYFKLDAFFDREISQYKGQCEEKASDKDFDKFPNQ